MDGSGPYALVARLSLLQPVLLQEVLLAPATVAFDTPLLVIGYQPSGTSAFINHSDLHRIGDMIGDTLGVVYDDRQPGLCTHRHWLGGSELFLSPIWRVL